MTTAVDFYLKQKGPDTLTDRIRKLPIGVQSFANLRNDGYLYADKTAHVYRLVHSGSQYFLSRPRRFGKSLFLSTLRAYWEGRKELFRGLRIEKLEKDNPDAWKTYPVFYFDFNRDNYQADSSLEKVLDDHLRLWEEQYAVTEPAQSLALRFQKLLRTAYEQTGLRCVILVDEYDKPFLDVLEDDEKQSHNRAVFKGVFSSLKSFDDYIQFAFVTGVTRFSKVSVFSDLNHLRDISLHAEYADICGLTEDELYSGFLPEITLAAKAQGISLDECLGLMRRTYDGYHFSPGAEGIYNPFSVLNALYNKSCKPYWFETGTPAFLLKRLVNIGFDVRSFSDRKLFVSESMLSDYQGDSADPIPLLYQSGYLTIVDYDGRRERYTLGFPNEEVKYGFLESLMPAYVPDYSPGTHTDIFSLDAYLEDGNLDGVRDVITALFAGIPYTSGETAFEHYFQSVLYIVFTLLGKFTKCEQHTVHGRIDCVVETDRFVYLFEFKRDDSADKALQQIADKGYALPYAADTRRLYCIGANFDSESRQMTEWKVQER